MLDADTKQWLEELLLEIPVSIGGESVYLKTYPEGAELGAYLIRAYTDEQLEAVLKQGFQSAIEFEAGFSLSPDEDDLLLTQWLPGVRDWLEAAAPLENLLDQITMLRAALAPPGPKRTAIMDRDEQRIRRMIEGRAK
jgi:hypothetical protein